MTTAYAAALAVLRRLDCGELERIKLYECSKLQRLAADREQQQQKRAAEEAAYEANRQPISGQR